jgi:hypothetical protein
MTWLQTASGRAFDLIAPDWRQVDFDVDVAEALARIARFTGHVRAGPYSVAQHCVVGADAVFRETKDRKAAAAFLLHDAHEAYLGDIATPIVWALAARARLIADRTNNLIHADAALFGDELVKSAIASLKAGLDQAIYRAAGVTAGGPPSVFHDIVKRMDLAMLATEARHLLGPAPQPWAILEGVEPIRMVGRLTVWPWPQAADEYRERLRRYLPERFAPATPSPKSGPRHDGARLIRHPKPELTEA